MNPLLIGAAAVAGAAALYELVLKPAPAVPPQEPPPPPPPRPRGEAFPVTAPWTYPEMFPPGWEREFRSPPPTPTTPESSAVGWHPWAMEYPRKIDTMPGLAPLPAWPGMPVPKPTDVIPGKWKPQPTDVIPHTLPEETTPPLPPPTPTEPVEEAEPEESCYQCSPGALIQTMTPEEAEAYSGICVQVPEANCEARPSIPTLPGGIPLTPTEGQQTFTMGLFGRHFGG